MQFQKDQLTIFRDNLVRVVVVVPCFNEARRLDRDAFARFLQEADPGVRLLLVNDGSTDRTLEHLRELAAHYPERLDVLDLTRNVGKAEAVRQGVLRGLEHWPSAEFVGYWDADLATPLEEIPGFLRVFQDRPHLVAVIGSRVKLMGRQIERRATRHYLGRVFATFASLSLGLSVYDTQCGAKLFRVSEPLRAVFAEPFHSRWIFDVEILARMQRLARLEALPPVETVVYEYVLSQWRDVAGSKLKPTDFLRAALELVRIARHTRHWIPQQMQTRPEILNPKIMLEPEYERMYRTEDHYWWFVARRELVADWVARLNLPEGAVILDVGCGTGANALAWTRFGTVVGVDFSDQALERCQRRGLSELARGDATKLPLGDATADALVATDILEHLEDDRAALIEWKRVLKPGGHLVLTVPAYRFLWGEHDVALMHHRRYVASELLARAREVGFEVTRSTYAFSLLLPVAVVQRLLTRKPPGDRPPEAKFPAVPDWLNTALIRFQRLETSLLRHLSTPFGLSVLAVLKRPT